MNVFDLEEMVQEIRKSQTETQHGNYHHSCLEELHGMMTSDGKKKKKICQERKPCEQRPDG